jgi:ribonuclease-3
VPDLDILQSRLGYTFQDVSLLQLALTHPSIAHEQGSPLVQHNQRLEFLGDSVLGLALTRELYLKFPTVGEGALTKARAQMVNRRTLAEQGRLLELGEYLVLSRGEEANGGRTRESALADAFEAVLGAMFLDGGFDAAQGIILQCFRDSFGELTEIPSLDNPKGELQEILQANSSEAPLYELISSSGPDHDRVFECVVRHGGNELGRGFGKSKKAAESEAANAALNAIKERSALPTASEVPGEPEKN